jgi:hypothetical protein
VLRLWEEVVLVASYGPPEGGEAINAFEAKGRLLMTTFSPGEGFHLEIKVEGESPIHLPFCGCARKSWTMAWVRRKGNEEPTEAEIDKVYETIKRLETERAEKTSASLPKIVGAEWNAIMEACPEIWGNKFTEAVNALLDRAKIYEPVLGVLRTI